MHFSPSFSLVYSTLEEVRVISDEIIHGQLKDKPRVEIQILQTSPHTLDQARKRLIITGFARSYKQFSNNIRLFAEFCAACSLDPLKIDQTTVEYFVTIFRNQSSCRNAIGSLKNFCQILEKPLSWDCPALRRLMKNVGKNVEATTIGLKPGIELELLTRLCKLCRSLYQATQLTLWLEICSIMALAFNFLLRLPSECLPLVFSDTLEKRAHSAVVLLDDALMLTLRRRKNSERPICLERACNCAANSAICPLHTLQTYISRAQIRKGGRFFSLTPERFTEKLRQLLGLLKVPNPELYTTHCFRRGAARSI